MKVFKMCYQLENGQLESCCRNYDFPQQYKAKYGVGKTTLPTIPNSRLFAFKTAQAAFDFRSQFSSETQQHMVVLECDATGVVTIKNNKWISLNQVVEYWKARKARKSVERFYDEWAGDIPSGTVTCKTITPKWRLVPE